jgi:RNA polymerase sigma-70 factor, ECF subfamily
MSDRVTNLVQRAQSGDHTAAAELFSIYWRLARAAAFGVTGEWAAAEDAAAEGFRQAWAGIPSLQDADKFASWLRTIVIRQARCQAWEAGKVLELPPDAADPGESPEDQLQREQLAAVIRLALRHLPESLRETMALRYFEGYEPEEAARLLQIPRGTLRRRLHEGRTRLRTAVESILKGEKMTNKPDLDHLHRLLAEGDIYRAVRGALQLQPPAAELAASFRGRLKPPGAGVADAIHRMLRGHSSNSSADAMADSIRQALPSHFEDWVENEGEAARQFLTAGKRALPPGFAEGRPVCAADAGLAARGCGRPVAEHAGDGARDCRSAGISSGRDGGNASHGGARSAVDGGRFPRTPRSAGTRRASVGRCDSRDRTSLHQLFRRWPDSLPGCTGDRV